MKLTLHLLHFLIILAVSPALVLEEPHVKISVDKRVHCRRKSKDGDTLAVHYKGFLNDGERLFDSSGDIPYRFVLGYNQVVKGWDQGLRNMCVGDKRRLWIPSELAYGEKGSGYLIPPDTDLYFEVELIEIKSRDEL